MRWVVPGLVCIPHIHIQDVFNGAHNGRKILLSSNWQYAYSSTFLNTPVLQFKEYLNTSFASSLTEESYIHIWDIVQNIWFIGFFLGIWLSPFLNDRLGRKTGLLIANSANFIAAIVQFLGVWLFIPVLLIIGRFIASVMTAVAFQAVILYLQESPATSKRGTATYCSEVIFAAMCIVGMMLGADELLGNNLPWLLAVNILPCAISIVIIILVPETPKFLLIRKNDRKSAEAAIRFHHGKDVDVESVVEELLHEADEDSQEADEDSFLQGFPHNCEGAAPSQDRHSGRICNANHSFLLGSHLQFHPILNGSQLFERARNLVLYYHDFDLFHRDIDWIATNRSSRSSHSSPSLFPREHPLLDCLHLLILLTENGRRVEVPRNFRSLLLRHRLRVSIGDRHNRP
ncbi:hypothetical protein PMAYCL1PPCAC_22130, partial [Pristionchus mayeri]